MSRRGRYITLNSAGEQIAQRRMDAFELEDVIEKASDLCMGIGEVAILGERHLLHLDGSHQSLDIAILAHSDTLREARQPLPGNGHTGYDPAQAVRGDLCIHA